MYQRKTKKLLHHIKHQAAHDEILHTHTFMQLSLHCTDRLKQAPILSLIQSIPALSKPENNTSPILGYESNQDLGISMGLTGPDKVNMFVR